MSRITITIALALLFAACGDSSTPPQSDKSTNPAPDVSSTSPDTKGPSGDQTVSKSDGTVKKPDGTSGTVKVGDPCTATTTCPSGGSGKAVCRDTWPGGYCLVENCAEHGHDCPGDPGRGGTSGQSKCVLAPTATCLKLCTVESDCRTGYSCATKQDAAGHGPVKVCVPK